MYWKVNERLIEGQIATVDRPRDVSWLPALELAVPIGPHERARANQDKYGLSLRQVPGKMAWYEFDGGPQLTTILSEAHETKRHYLLEFEEREWAVGVLQKIQEFSAEFMVKATAPAHLIGHFKDFYRHHERSTETDDVQAILAASTWHGGYETYVAIRRSGHTMRYFFHPSDMAVLSMMMHEANELFEKLPSGSGFNFDWGIDSHAEEHFAHTEYYADDSEGGDREIEISYRLTRDEKTKKWLIEEMHDDGQGDDFGDYEYCATTMEECLNA